MMLAGAAALQAATGSVLGVDFGEPLPPSNAAQIATDRAGSEWESRAVTLPRRLSPSLPSAVAGSRAGAS